MRWGDEISGETGNMYYYRFDKPAGKSVWYLLPLAKTFPLSYGALQVCVSFQPNRASHLAATHDSNPIPSIPST